MSVESVSGRVYGPSSFSTDRSVVSRYIGATGDDPGRWGEAAPRSLAGAMLFVVAPRLLADPDLAGAARSVIHGEQTFSWLAPIPLDAVLSVSGTVTRVRERGGVHFVGFETEVKAGASPILTGTSMFLMSSDEPPAGISGAEEEPAPEVGSSLEPASGAEAVDGRLVPLRRSVSRLDLVRYAAASLDFNPIHWDHDSAIAAGLPGVVVHGLLQSAWLTQAVERTGAQPSQVRFRYRSPLRPAVPVTVSGVETAEGWDTRLVADDDTEHVVGSFKTMA
jgi:acyl dehydratase